MIFFPSGEYGADFRDGLIGRVWRNDAEDTPGFDWSIGQWGTSTENTGPPKDHSSGTGKEVEWSEVK